jgi:hypothetical protein
MSFQTVAAISLAIEVVVLCGIVLTLANAFSDGRIAASFRSLTKRTQPQTEAAGSAVAAATSAAEEVPLRRAA